MDEADKLIQSITDAEYIELYRNVKNIQKLILDGAYTRKTLQDAIIEVLESACAPVQNRYQDHISRSYIDLADKLTVTGYSI